jgi:hypothetical protein
MTLTNDPGHNGGQAINRLTSMFKFSQISHLDVNSAAARFILANMGALRLKEPCVLIGLIGELCQYIAGQPIEPDFTPPSSYKRTSHHLADSNRYTQAKLENYALGLMERKGDVDWVSPCVAMARLQDFKPHSWSSDEAIAWVKANGDKHEHDGFKVDLSFNETRDFLKNCRLHIYSRDGHWGRSVEAQVLYNGMWWDLCRTDLKDNVATTRGHGGWYGIDKLRELWSQQVRFGTRFNVWDDTRRSFSIIDAWSDG